MTLRWCDHHIVNQAIHVHVCVQDFATSSLKGEVATENEELVEVGTLEEYTIAERKEWEKR